MKDDDLKARVIPFPRAAMKGADAGPNGVSDDHDADQGGEHGYAKPLLTLKKHRLAQRLMLMIPRWVTPNGVTVFRALLIIPIAWLLTGSAYWAALGVIAVAMLLDWVDGALAAARDQRTPSGAFLDPLADKVLICGSLLSLLGRLPWPFQPATLAVCAIATVLTMVRIVKMAKARQGLSGSSVAAKPAGKLKLVAETASLLLTVLGLALGVSALVWIGFAFLVVSLWYAFGSLRGQLFG